ncbi:YacL family protein [Alishewanella longhuensis]
MDEFEHNKASYQQLITALRALTAYQEWQFFGREYSLLVQRQEVRICYNTLLSSEQFQLPELLEDADLQLDEHLLESECGLADLCYFYTPGRTF